MKNIVVFLIGINSIIFQYQKSIYFGENGLNKFYFEYSNSDSQFIEIGGTSMKMGGEHIALIKNNNSIDGVFYENQDKGISLRKKNEIFVLKYKNRFGDKKIILNEVIYNNIIDRIRQNSFRMVHKKYMRINDFNQFLIEFNKFKNNPTEYKSNN